MSGLQSSAGVVSNESAISTEFPPILLSLLSRPECFIPLEHEDKPRFFCPFPSLLPFESSALIDGSEDFLQAFNQMTPIKTKRIGTAATAIPIISPNGNSRGSPSRCWVGSENLYL